MKTEKNIMIAFILNLCFSIFELIGGFITGSIAILSDALHDAGDASSIGVSFFLEKKSKKQPLEKLERNFPERFRSGKWYHRFLALFSWSALQNRQ